LETAAAHAAAAAKPPAAAPYPPSPVITKLTWAPADTIIRLAPDSDTWPITWGPDDRLYTSFADGRGFVPHVPEKLSMGIAAVAGAPPDIKGVNIRSADIERKGGGKSGQKASGSLMVGGVWYLWVRNADRNGSGCQLAWSADRGKTWTWSKWQFAELGYCTFINYGKDYAGARDGFVYTVTPDSPSAYVSTDRFVLLRVPKDKIGERAAYEFYAGPGAGGEPAWSKDFARRQGIFTHPRQCLRSGMSYNAALKRYLWWQHLPGGGAKKEDTRFRGGFGVYDAPEPWGPWTMVYFTKEWDVGPGETASFPTKWMSPDGKTVHLVFSGNDHFSVRKATLTTAP
jgi:hypothetical protein